MKKGTGSPTLLYISSYYMEVVIWYNARLNLTFISHIHIFINYVFLYPEKTAKSECFFIYIMYIKIY